MGAIILGDRIALTKHSNDNVKLKSTIAIGAAVLDLSKLVMFDLVYNKLTAHKKNFNCSIVPVGGDTDSLFLAISQVDLYKQLIPKMIDDKLLDTSNYPKTHKKFSN